MDDEIDAALVRANEILKYTAMFLTGWIVGLIMCAGKVKGWW